MIPLYVILLLITAPPWFDARLLIKLLIALKLNTASYNEEIAPPYRPAELLIIIIIILFQ